MPTATVRQMLVALGLLLLSNSLVFCFALTCHCNLNEEEIRGTLEALQYLTNFNLLDEPLREKYLEKQLQSRLELLSESFRTCEFGRCHLAELSTAPSLVPICFQHHRSGKRGCSYAFKDLLELNCDSNSTEFCTCNEYEYCN